MTVFVCSCMVSFFLRFFYFFLLSFQFACLCSVSIPLDYVRTFLPNTFALQLCALDLYQIFLSLLCIWLHFSQGGQSEWNNITDSVFLVHSRPVGKSLAFTIAYTCLLQMKACFLCFSFRRISVFRPYIDMSDFAFHFFLWT